MSDQLGALFGGEAFILGPGLTRAAGRDGRVMATLAGELKKRGTPSRHYSYRVPVASAESSGLLLLRAHRPSTLQLTALTSRSDTVIAIPPHHRRTYPYMLGTATAYVSNDCSLYHCKGGDQVLAVIEDRGAGDFYKVCFCIVPYHHTYIPCTTTITH